MKRVIYTLFAVLAIVALGIGITRAQELTFTSGEVLNHTLSVCLEKKDALAIVEAHEKHGREKANELWMAAARCANLPVVGPVVGKVIKSAKTKEGISSVVEILNDGKVIGWFLTTSPVNKPQRNT